MGVENLVGMWGWVCGWDEIIGEDGCGENSRESGGDGKIHGNGVGVGTVFFIFSLSTRLPYATVNCKM